MGSQCCKCAKQNKSQNVTGYYTDSGKFRYRENQPIPSHRYHVQTRGKIVQLTLKQSQKDDTGHYALVAKKLSANDYSLSEHDHKEIIRQKIRMNVRESSDNLDEGEPPVFVRRLTDLAVKVGTRTRFLVEIRSSSSPKVTWHRNDLPVQSGSRFSFVHEGNFYCVDVAPVMVEDQGHWTCMVENINGRSSCTSCLSVIVPKAYKPPEFVEKLRALLTETGTVSLECKVVGVPTPVLRWFKDEKEIKAGDVFALTANIDDPTSLGTYTCQAVNCMGTACSSSRVHVMGRGSREGSLKPADTLLPAGPLPVFKKILKDESCRIGDSIMLSCQVQVPPWPKAITWYNKEGRVEPDEKYHLIEDGLGIYSIKVDGVEAMDEGEWKCVATSAENVMQFTTCFVAMSIPKNYRMPRFMESLKAVLTDEGLVSFECKVVGFPTPLLKWFKDGQELKPGDVYQLTGTNSLGSYCCIAKNCMGEARSTAELTIEDIQNQLNEEERLQLISTNDVPKFIKGLRSCEAKIHEDFRFTIQVSISPAPTLSWYRDDEPIIEGGKYKMIREVLGTCHLDVHKLEFIDQAEWKCVAANDFGHSITSCFLKLIIPKHFKKPKFLESLRAILSEEGAVNLECKVIGVPQPILKWYKDGVELKPGDIHRIISGQDGTCSLGVYTCEATNCMGSVSSSASLLGFDDRVGVRNEESKEPNSPLPHELARNLSLSTIHEERTSQLYDTPQTDHSITIDDRGEVSFSFDGKEVSVSLYETPDLTEEEAIQIVEMYADQLSEHITEGNVIELPPMRFMKETSTTGNLLMEAVVIDVSPDYFAGEDEDDLRTEADFEDVSIMDDQMQSILSSYSAPPGEESGERTPMGSPPPRPPRRKERSGSASSKSDKSDKSQPKIFDWSESYHSAKEPSMHAQLSLQSQDSVDAFADALSSEGFVKLLPKETPVKTVSDIKEHMCSYENIEDERESVPVALLQSPKFTEEVFAAALMDTELSGKKKRKKKQSKGGTPMLSSKTSSEESYTMSLDGYEPEEKVQRRGSSAEKEKRERRDSNSSNKSNKSTRSGKEKKKRKSRGSEQSLKIEEMKLEKVGEMLASHLPDKSGVYYNKKSDGLLEVGPASTASLVSTTAGEIPDKSMSKSQKERLLENLNSLSNPVLVLRNTLVDLDNILMTYSENKENVETVRVLILQQIVQPVENLCEQMSVIEMKAVKSAGDKSLMQDIRISLLDSIGGPTEELLRGIELIRSHEYKSPEDFKSDLIVLESLTDPVDEIIAGLAKIHHELKCKEGIAVLIAHQEHPIILERMTRAISRLGINVGEFVRQNHTPSADSQVAIIGERLECIYQNLDSFVIALPLDKVTGALESNVDTLVIETLVKPLEGLIRVLGKVSSHEIVYCDEHAIDSLRKAIFEVKTKLETLTIALETYEIESEKIGITEKNLELVNYLKWTMDDLSEKLIKLKTRKTINIPKVDDDIPGSIPVSSDEEWKLDSASPKENSPQSSNVIDEVKIIEDEVEKLQESDELTKSHASIEAKEMVATITEELTPNVQIINQPADASSKRTKYKSRLTSVDSATVELDETLSIPEMLLDPLIDIQAKLNRALRHYEDQNTTDASSSSITEISNCLTQLRESIASAAHIATTLNISSTLNSIMDLREPLLNFQLALSSNLSPSEIILLEEVIRPVNELNELVTATIRSSSVSESSQVILKQVIRMIEDIQERLLNVSAQKTSLETPIDPVIKMIAVQPPKDIENTSLSLTGVHFALSSVLAMANDYPIDESSNNKTVIDGSNATSAYRLISSIETLRQCVGNVAISIASPVVPAGSSMKYNYEVVSDELTKLKNPLLDLQKVLLTEKHQPEERHLLNGVATPLRALREAILEVSKGRSNSVLELLEDVEKDVSLIAMETLKMSLEGKIAKEESSVSDITPGEVPRIVSRWLDPIENWLTSASTEIDEKGQIKSIVAPVVDNFKRQLLKIAIQSSYSEPPSDIALIEELAELREPLSKVCDVISSQHNSNDLEVLESLIQPTKHLLGTILDASLIHRASSVLRPVIEALEELENQIPLSIKTATYERTLQGVVRSMTPETFESDENIKRLEQLESGGMSEESAIATEMIETIEVNLDAATSSQIKVDVHEAPFMILSDMIEQEESIPVDEKKNCIAELPQVEHDKASSEATTENLVLEKNINLNERLNETPINVDDATEEELMKRRQSQISSATARAEELDLWTLTLLGPLERLANCTLALDRSIDEDIHAHLCRPLDSLYKQIELVESQINRPAGQTLENDVETIIEGFLSPVNQVATALKVAMDVWHETPAKDVVIRHLSELSESCSILCKQFESLRQKLITEAPVQTLQVQKTEASVVETIMAVLGPLEGISKVILKILEENRAESEEEIDNLIVQEHTDGERKFKRGKCDDKNYKDEEVTENLMATEAHDSEPQEEIKHIEAATARPLQELIEAIVDADSVRHTSTTPEEMERIDSTGDKNAIREKNLHEILEPDEDNIKLDVTPDNNKIREKTTITTEEKIDQFNVVEEKITNDFITNMPEDKIELLAVQRMQEEFIKHNETSSTEGKVEQYLQDSQQFDEVVPEDMISNIVTNELQEHELPHIETESIGKTTLVQIKQIFVNPSTDNELQIVEEAIHDLIVKELEKQKIDPSDNENLITVIEQKLHTLVLQHATISREHILEATIHDIIVDIHEVCEKVIDDGKNIVEGEATMTYSLSEAEETRSEINEETISLSFSKVGEIKTDIDQGEAIAIDVTIYVNRVRDIARSELDRQNALSFDNEDLMINIEKSVKEIMMKYPQVCQENVFEESVRDIVIEELQKIKNHHVKDVTMIAEEITESKNNIQEATSDAIEIPQERIYELIQNELCRQNIKLKDDNNLLQIMETKVQDTILLCPQVITENFLEERVYEVIMEEISKWEAGKNIVENLAETKNLLPELKTNPLIAEITDLHVVEETIQNTILDELQKQHVLTSAYDEFAKEVTAKIQEIMVAHPEKLEENVEEIVRNIVSEELTNSKEMLHVEEDHVYAQDCNSNYAVQTMEPWAISRTSEVMKEKIQYILEEEIQKVNIQLANQHAIVSSVQAKIQEIAISSVQISEQNTSEDTIREMIVNVIEEQLSELESNADFSSSTNIVASSVNTILDEQTAINENLPEEHIRNLDEPMPERKTDSVHQENNNLNTILDAHYETILQSANISEVPILDKNPDEHRVEYSARQNMVNVAAGEIVKNFETAVEDTQVHNENITDIKSLDEGNISQEDIFGKDIRELVTEVIIEQNAESLLNDEFLNTATAKIQQMIINNPEPDTKDLLKITVQEIIVTKLKDEKEKIIMTENSSNATKLQDESPIAITQTPDVITQDNIDKMISEELHKQNIMPLENDQLTSVIDSKVQDLIAKLPEVSSAHTIEESVQNIIIDTLEKEKAATLDTEALAKANEQKTKIKISAITSPDGTAILEETVHELIIGELHKFSIHPSSENNVIRAVETKVQELMVQQSDISDLATLEKYVFDMMVEVIKEEKAQVTEIEELSEVDKREIKVENIAKPAITQGQVSPLPEEMVHELIIDELHKQNIQAPEEGNIMKAIQGDIQMLIIQNPDITELDALEGSIQNIVARALVEERSKLHRNEELVKAEIKEITVQDIKPTPPVQMEPLPDKVVHALIVEEIQRQNIEPPQANNLIKFVQKKIHELTQQHPETSELNTLQENIKMAVVEILKEQKANVVEVNEYTTSEGNKVQLTESQLFTTAQKQAPPTEIIHLLIVEELNDQNIELSGNSNLIKSVETKIQEMIMHQPELSNLDVLEQRIHDVVADILRRETGIFATCTEDLPAEEKLKKVEDIKIPSSVQTKTLPEECIRPLIIQELHKHNVEPSQDANFLKAIESQIQSMIDVNPEICESEVFNKKIHNIVAEVLKEQRAQILDAEELGTAKEIETKVEHIQTSSRIQTKSIPDAFIQSVIIDELHNQDIQPLEELSLVKAIETRVESSIDVQLGEFQHEIICEKIHDIVAEVLNEQQAQVCTTEKLNRVEETSTKIDPVEIISPIEPKVSPQEFTHSIISDKLCNQNSQSSDNTSLTNIIETQIQNLIAENPEMCQKEVLDEKVHNIIAEVLKEQPAEVANAQETIKTVMKQISEEDIKIPTTTQTQAVSNEVVHDLIIDELHKQNVKQSEESGLIKAIEIKLQNIIAACPELSKEDIIDGKVQDIIAEILEEQQAIIITTEKFGYAVKEQVKIEDIFQLPPAQEIEISQDIHKMIDDELHERNIALSISQDQIEAINTKVLELVQQQYQVPEKVVSKECIRDVVSQELLRKKEIYHKVEHFDAEPEHIVNSGTIQLPSEAAEHVSEEVVHELVVKAIDKQNIQPSKIDDFVKAVATEVRNLIDASPEISNADRIKETVITGKLTDQQEKFHDDVSTVQEQEHILTLDPLPKNTIQMPEEIIEKLIIEELYKHSIEENTSLLNEIKMTVQNMIDNNPKCAERSVIDEKIKAITATALTELKTQKNKYDDSANIKKPEKEIKDFKTSSTVQSDIPEEIVHELIIDELSKQNVQPSEEASLNSAIHTKCQDLIAQQSAVSQEHIDEESIHEIDTKNLEKQKANMIETEQLSQTNQESCKHEILNHPSSIQIHISDEVVHDMIIDEYHKHNIEPLAEENLVKAIESRLHDLIANHPDMCNNDIFEESVHDIVNEVRAEQKANILQTENLAKANEQNVKVEVSPAPNTTPAVASKNVLEDELPKKSEMQPMETFKDEKHANSQELKYQNESDKHIRISKNNKVETEQDKQNEIAENRKEPKLMTVEKKEKEHLNNEQRQLAKEVMTQHVETSSSITKHGEKDDIKNESQRGNIQLQTDVESQSDKKHNVQEEFERGEFFSTQAPVVIPAVNTDSEFDSELSECSKSTLKDVSYLQNRKQSIPPMIEIDYDISSAKEMSSHRSMASTKRFRDQQSFDLDDRSLGVYSSTTSRVQSLSHGPRDRGKKPTFCTKLTDRTAAEASRIKLTCTVLGDPEPEVYWTKDGKQLPSSTNRHCTTTENGLASLEFYAVTPKDSGEYSCIAINIHGQSCTESKLKVYAGYEPTPSLPTFTRSIKESYRIDENALILECRVRGKPSPTITWLKDGQVLEICDRYQQSDLADGICRLRIFKPDFYDSGLYTCRAENDTRLSDRTSHLVNFEATGNQQSVPSWRGSISGLNITSTYKDTGRPRFSSYLTDHNVPAGGTIALQVEVKGVPPPEITWMKTDKRGPISVPKARTFADSDVYTLIVPDATESETGTYICRASNAYGHVDTSANVEVVPGSGHDGGKPAMFISRPPDKHVIVAVGEDVSVSFRTTGVPKPRVIWMKGLRDITSGPRSYKEGHDDYVRLTLKRACPSDEGTYCILVKNCYGCDRSFFTVQVRQRARSLTPSPDWGPLDTDNLLSNIHDKERTYLKQVPGPISSEPIVVDGGRNWLALTWGKAEQKGPAPVVAYRVDAWLLGGEGGARWAELGVTPINAFDAFNLRPGEEYKFRITPRNRYGWGEPVTMTNSVTVREIVKFPEFTKILPGQLKALVGTVLNLEAEVTSDSLAQVKWYCDTTEIENGRDSRFTTYFNGSKCSLMIGNISESDSSRYVCEATNAAGRVSTFARVQVVEDVKVVEADLNLRKMRSSEIMNEERPPEFTMRLRDRRVQASYPVRLTCQVTGYPEPEVTWYKYREEIYSHDNIAIWNDEAHFHTLEISRSTIDDSGIYMARAKNVYGSVTCRCHLVVDKGIRAYIAPEFLGHLDSVYTVKAGGELRMTAQVEAYPTVGITWHRDGHRLRPSRDVIMTLNHDGTVELELAHVTPRDAGLYCCTANNEVGQAESTTRVTILETSEINSLNQSVPNVVQTTNTLYSKVPLFVTKPLSTEALEGDMVIIQCEVIGDPKPEVMWLRDFLRPDYYKDAPHFRRIGAGPEYRLEIPYAKFDFTGTYSIIAKNCNGEAKAVISLQIYARGQGKEDSGMESTIKHGNVQTLPVITRPLRDLRCCDGDAITLVCKIRATPEPDVRWEKGEKLVPIGGDFAADFDGETARLSIQHVYPEDEGEYTCIAYNDLGKAYTSACLVVDVPEGKETALSRRLTKPPGFLSANSTPISTPRSTPVRSLSPSCASRRELKPMTKISRGQSTGKRPRMPTGPKFYAVPHNRVAEEGETVRFQCAVAGHPSPWVTWDKDGISVTPTARISLTEKDDVRILEITEITHEDAGLYRITLENDVGRTEATARLEIIRGRHNSVSKLVGTRSASPRTYSIYGRGRLSPSPRPDTRLQPPRATDAYPSRGGTISPTFPRWHQRNGKQSVQTDMKTTSNGNAIMTSSTKIVRSSSIPRQTSFEKPSDEKNLPGSPIRFKKHIKTQSIPCRSPANQSSTIFKRAEANPKSKLSKKRSSTLISLTNASNKSKIPLNNDNNDVTALSTTPTTTTKSNEVISTNCTNKEETYLSMKPKSPKILAAPADVIALRGGKVTLLATYDGCPKPTIKWLRKGQYVTLDDKTEIETGGGLTCLTLVNITTNESGKYEVRIENTVGSDSKYVNVTVEGPPEPPADKPTIHSVIPSGSIILTWRTPVYDGGCAVTGYTVEMRRGDEPCWITVAEARHSLTHTVQQLDETESYRFRVRAENIHGLSEPGMESDVITISSETTTDKMSNNIFGIEMNNENESGDEFEPAFEARIVSTEPGNLFEERYEVLEELGKGRYGIVRRIIDTASGLNLAAKFVRTIKFKDRQQVYDEINIMNILRHPKLLRLAAAYENPKEMIMVTEYISGGELFERVVADDFTLTEKDSILFVRQICQGVEYMHTNNIVHLDLKPENIMCHTRTSHRIKLIDFGLAQTLKPDTPVRVLFGTPEFIPPEIIGFEPIGTESDMWSVGVICYVLLSGLSPFMGENDAETFANITRADHDFDDKAFHAISQEAQDFISALLIKRKKLRMSATDCLQHPWLAQHDDSMSRVALPTDKLKKFIVRRKWQKTGNAIRALGRMATLSANSRRNMSSSPPFSKSFDEDINFKICSDDINEVPIGEHIEHFAHPTPDNSPDNLKNISYKNEYDKNEVEIEEIDDEIEGLQTSINLSLDEILEQNSNDFDNAESSIILDTERSNSFDEYTRFENNENIFTYDENSSTTCEFIEDETNTAEFPTTLDEVSSENDTIFTAIDSTINHNTVTLDISPKSIRTITEECDNNTSRFCTFKNLHITEPAHESLAFVPINRTEIVGEKGNERTDTCVESITEDKQEELSSVIKDQVAPTRPSFIDIKSSNNSHDCVPKPWFHTNSSSLDSEGEVARIVKTSPLRRIVRTGSVSRTAKLFEQDELSSPIRQATSPGSRIVIPAPDARPQNDRIRKAFAFWNK